MIDLLFSQLTDVFRIGLIIALVVTMYRTAPVTGHLLPLACGVVFVAVILPTTMSDGTGHLPVAILAGLVSNLAILVMVVAVARMVAMIRRQFGDHHNATSTRP